MVKKIYHFDINGTITNIDSTENADKKELMNINISKNIFGKLSLGKWQINDNPFNRENSLSYYNYCKRFTDIKFSRNFTNANHEGEQFNEIAKKMIDDNNLLFKSFIKFLECMDNGVIILRTFGNDADIILNEINRLGFNKQFIKGSLEGNYDNYVIKLETGQVFNNYDDFNNYLVNADINLCLRDDYHLWNNNNKERTKGKPIKHYSGIKQIFFDDNDCVNVLENSEDITFVHVNTIECFMDENFYIKYI